MYTMWAETHCMYIYTEQGLITSPAHNVCKFRYHVYVCTCICIYVYMYIPSTCICKHVYTTIQMYAHTHLEYINLEKSHRSYRLLIDTCIYAHE